MDNGINIGNLLTDILQMLLHRLLDYLISVNLIFQLVFPCRNFDETELFQILVRFRLRLRI